MDTKQEWQPVSRSANYPLFVYCCKWSFLSKDSPAYCLGLMMCQSVVSCTHSQEKARQLYFTNKLKILMIFPGPDLHEQ